MRTRIIESLDKWYILKQALIEQKYILFQMQYSYSEPEGFHAWFSSDKNSVEVITHAKEVQHEIISFNTDRKRIT